jgi:hypothetical protein
MENIYYVKYKKDNFVWTRGGVRSDGTVAPLPKDTIDDLFLEHEQGHITIIEIKKINNEGK